MANYYKRVPRAVPAYAEALGVRSPEEMKYVVEVDGHLIFQPPNAELLDQLMANAERAATENQPPSGGKPGGSATDSSSNVDGGKNVSTLPLTDQRHQPVQASSSSGSPQSTSATCQGSSSLLIDLDSMPTWPNYLQVRRHRPGGQFFWLPSAVMLFRSSKQITSGLSGNALKTELRTKKGFNANLLHWLILNPSHFPIGWELNGRKIFFFETIYDDAAGRACVVYVTYHNSRWTVGYRIMTDTWTPNDFVACRR
ncbi:MAG: hypothetical protein V1738_06410 [Patescibacteria group bacterium]